MIEFGMPKTLAVKLTAAGERAVKQNHPWIYENSIEKISADGQVGDKAIIFDKKKNRFLGIGLYDPYSPIRIKLLIPREKAQLDEAWFFGKLRSCFEQRSPLFEITNAYRLVYGESDGLPGFIVDVYNDTAVIKLYSLIWMPYLDSIKKGLVDLLNPRAIVLRLSRHVTQLLEGHPIMDQGPIIHGELSNPVVTFQEYNVQFSAHLLAGHKTGYFLDHRQNRHLVGKQSKNKSVLDVFSYAGGFSVHALTHGAKHVVSVDISKHALELAKQNAALNGIFKQHETRAGDAFVLLEEANRKGEKFDVIIVDPPSFAKSKGEIPTAIKQYRRLTKLVLPLLDRGGLLCLASCSSRISKEDFFDSVEAELKASKRSFTLLEKTYHDIDHPVSFPEGAYLKTGYYQF